MRDDDSFLEIFQDPLLTIIAIILINTTWVFIPDVEELVDSDSHVMADEMFALKKDVRVIEDKANRLKTENQRKKKELDWLKEKINETKEISREAGKEDELILQKIKDLEEEIKRKKDELKQLEDAIKKAKDELAKAKGKEVIEEIQNKIRELEKEIEKKRSELRGLESQIIKTKRNMVNSEEKTDEQKRLVAQLQNKLKALLEEIKKIEAEIKRLRSGEKSGRGFKSIKDSNKEPIYIELVKNRLFPIDEKHYKGYEYNGNTVIERKTSAKGESIYEIGKLGSAFHKLLNKVNRKKERIVFFVHGDSYKIFRKTREIALKKGIVADWWPYEQDVFVISSGGSGRDIPTTDQSTKKQY